MDFLDHNDPRQRLLYNDEPRDWNPVKEPIPLSMRANTKDIYLADDDTKYGPPGNRKPGVVEYEARKMMEGVGNGNLFEQPYVQHNIDPNIPNQTFKSAGVDYNYKETPPPPGWQPKNSGVFICKQPADTLGGYFDHWWLKTPEKEAGYGEANGTVPGDGAKGSPYVTQTAIVEHSGRSRESDVRCTQFPNVNKTYINNAMEIGKKTGPWTPTNNCRTWVVKKIGEAYTED